MSHEVFGDRFIGRREPAWHALGTVFDADEQLTVRQAYERVHIDYTFEKQPIALPMAGVDTSSKVALVRSPTFDDSRWRFIDTVSSDYGVIQPLELADALDKSLSHRYPVETAGALHHGATNFATLKLDSYDIRGEPMEQYFLLSNSNGVNRSMHILVTDIRVVCANTLNAALNKNDLKVAIPHTANIKRDMEMYIDLVAAAEAAANEQRILFNAMARMPLVRSGLMAIVQAAYPDPRMPQRARVLGAALEKQGLTDGPTKLYNTEQKAWQSARERNAQFRDAAIELYDAWGDRDLGGKLTVNTVWAAVNSVAEVSDNRIGNSVESAAVATLLGDRYQERIRATTVAQKYMTDHASDLISLN